MALTAPAKWRRRAFVRLFILYPPSGRHDLMPLTHFILSKAILNRLSSEWGRKYAQNPIKKLYAAT